ncbi:MAG TPA: DUF4956 domain-containing protein [Bacteroidales bacterium]|jgi:hypothetical protein|nr:DUF4956 domain-containing protein [Bacteroidales bacterium]MDI9532226.1 DUF4956 domain-containing protein [Bacteroidota bacterium]MBP8708775.1 DUF4956 domain-containing protein [Bacteroidales bacterium]HNV65781.1 DUF4956 domain-containing protein [Bacteroidales bacterium]HNY57042.1 DUF4956 domain-containing protein [Bacteroidales bacterium]
MNITGMTLPDISVAMAGQEMFSFAGLPELLLRFCINLVVILVLVRWLYYSTTRRKDYLFTYILISSVVFLLCYLLESVSLQIGFALGLFAIFGIIRYRTNPMPIKEMTYLFLVIGISVINALTAGTSMIEIIFANLAVILITLGLEKVWLLRHISSKSIIYEKINLIVPEKYDEMIADLQQRTGIKEIKKVEIGAINFLKDTCRMIIYYEDRGRNVNLADQNGFIKQDDNDDD